MKKLEQTAEIATGLFQLRFVSDEAVYEGSPLVLPAGRRGTLVVSYVHRGEPMQKGGSLRFQDQNAALLLHAQTTYPEKLCYCRWETSSSAALEVVCRDYRGMLTKPFLSVTVKDGMLSDGDTFICRIGDRSGGSPGMYVYATAGEGQICISLDHDGSGKFLSLAESPVPLIIAARKEASFYRLLLPSVITPGESFTVLCSAWDIYRNRADAASSTLHLSGMERFAGLPDQIVFTPEEEGCVTVNNVTVNRGGLYRIAFSDKEHNIHGLSNPLWAETNPPHRVYWGDLHCHGYGDRSGYLRSKTPSLDPALKTKAIKDCGGLDFASLSPMNLPEDGQQIWQDYSRAVEQNTQSDFTPFQAKEFHCNPGRDRTVIYRDREDAPPDSLTAARDLYEVYAGHDDVLIECHVGGGAADWDIYSHGEEDLLEITSGHGNFEWFLQKALQRGFHPAVIGASDAHHDLPGGPRGLNSLRGRFTPQKTDNFISIPRDWGFTAGSVAAVYAKDNGREILWRQLRARHTYATTGARILLELSINDQPMGSQITTATAPRLQIKVHGTAQILFVDVIRGSGLLKRFTPNALDFSETLADDTLPEKESTWYYIRLRQKDGEYAWSTPVWVDNAGFKPTRAEVLPPWYAPALTPRVAPEADAAAASRYTEEVMAALRLRCAVERLTPLVPVGIVDETPGRAVLFHSAVMPQNFPISIRYYCDLEFPDFHFDFGWEDFGLADDLYCAPGISVE